MDRFDFGAIIDVEIGYRKLRRCKRFFKSIHRPTTTQSIHWRNRCNLSSSNPTTVTAPGSAFDLFKETILWATLSCLESPESSVVARGSTGFGDEEESSLVKASPRFNAEGDWFEAVVGPLSTARSDMKFMVDAKVQSRIEAKEPGSEQDGLIRIIYGPAGLNFLSNNRQGAVGSGLSSHETVDSSLQLFSGNHHEEVEVHCSLRAETRSHRLHRLFDKFEKRVE